jgi:hypothetical protein
MSKPIGRVWMMALLLCTGGFGCGDEGEVGESCDEAGSKDVCVEGAICTNESGDEATCREICEEQADCPDGYGCNGVTGSSTKSCQPDDDANDKDKDGGK